MPFRQLVRAQDVGAAGRPLLRLAPAAFGDGHDTPAGADRPNPRDVSNSVVYLADQPESDRDMSTCVYIWGQVGGWLCPPFFALAWDNACRRAEPE